MLVPSGMRARYYCTQETYTDHVLLVRYEVRLPHLRQSESPVRPSPIACALATTSTNASAAKAASYASAISGKHRLRAHEEDEPTLVSAAGVWHEDLGALES